MSEVELMEENKIQRAEIILNKIFSSKTVSIEDSSGFLHIEDKLWVLRYQFCIICNNRQRKLTYRVHKSFVWTQISPEYLTPMLKKFTEKFTAKRSKKKKLNHVKESQNK